MPNNFDDTDTGDKMDLWKDQEINKDKEKDYFERSHYDTERKFLYGK